MNIKRISEIGISDSTHLGQSKKVIFHGSDVVSAITQVAYAELKAGDSIEEHSHDSMEEVFLVLDGDCEFTLNGIKYLLTKYDVIKIAPKIKHSLIAIGETKLYYFGVSIN